MPTLKEQIKTPNKHIKTRFTNLLLNVILAPKTGCSTDAFFTMKRQLFIYSIHDAVRRRKLYFLHIVNGILNLQSITRQVKKYSTLLILKILLSCYPVFYPSRLRALLSVSIAALLYPIYICVHLRSPSSPIQIKKSRCSMCTGSFYFLNSYFV